MIQMLSLKGGHEGGGVESMLVQNLRGRDVKKKSFVRKGYVNGPRLFQ